jgi:predicted MPP superfamily phosphohydrolase
MRLWRSSVDVVLRSTRKFYSREISWSDIVADDPDQAFASLCDQGMLIEEIQIYAKAGDVASGSCPNSISWPRQVESISPSLSGPPVRIVIISDTHSMHARMATVRAVLLYYSRIVFGFHQHHAFLQPLPAGDILVHCGDMTDTGKATEISSFLEWFASHPHPHKVMIAGNHDVTLDERYYASSWQRFHTERCNNLILEETSDGFVPPPTSARSLFYGNGRGIIALENAAVCIRGLQFWGSPFSAEFCKWSHSVERGQPAADLWKQIPSGTHVLLTHGPPVGYGDLVNERRTGDVSACI